MIWPATLVYLKSSSALLVCWYFHFMLFSQSLLCLRVIPSSDCDSEVRGVHASPIPLKWENQKWLQKSKQLFFLH